MSDGMTKDELNDIERFAPAWSSSPLRIAIAKLIAEIRRLWNTRQPPKLPRVSPEDLVEGKMKTVKVRIPVAVDKLGEWVSPRVVKDQSESRMMEQVDDERRHMSLPFSVHWITAEVPVPEPVEVEGRVDSP